MELAANILLALIIAVAILLVLVVLMQRPKSEGLGAAFGGGVTDNLFGAHTSTVLVKTTTYLAVTFFLAAVGYAALVRQIHSPLSETQQELLGAPLPEPATSDPIPATDAEAADTAPFAPIAPAAPASPTSTTAPSGFPAPAVEPPTNGADPAAAQPAAATH